MDEANLVELVHQYRAGNDESKEQLVAAVYERLIKLSRRMLRSSSAVVQRWEQTEDLAHSAWFRIQRVLDDESVEVQDDAHFFRLAARHIRFELIDLYRKLSGAHGIAANHQTSPREGHEAAAGDGERFRANQTADPKRLADWAEFHRVVEGLPDKEKAVVDLLWYQGLKQQAAADLLHVDVKTVKRRWRNAKLELSEKLDGRMVEF